MSDLLNSASLVMIPSGYKEDTIYSVVPSDGSGDLSFTRASNGTRVNSAGLVEDVPWNLFTYSEDFTNAGWNKDLGASVTANTTTAPNGTTTADTLTIASQQYFYQYVTLNAGESYTISVYVRVASGTKQFKFNTYGNGNDFTSSTYTATTEWQRFEYTFTTVASGSTAIYPVLVDGLAGGSFFIWGAQLNIGSTAKPYFPTTDRLNVPRLTYQNGGGGCPSLLLEKQSTNLVIQSQALTISTVNIGYTATDNNTTSPDGTQNASRVLEDTGTLHLIQKPYSVGSTTDYYTASFFIKSISRAKGRIVYGLDGAPYNSIDASFDLTAQTITSPTASGSGAVAGSSKIENFGNGWFRISISGIVGVSGTHYTRLIGLNDAGSDTYTGDPTKGFYAWGFQGEAGNYVTSYIPTTSSSATRVADDITNTFLQSGGFLGSNTGAMFVSGTAYNLSSNAVLNFVLTAGNNTTKAFLFDSVSNQIRLRTWDASSNTQSLTSGTITGNYKLCVSWTSSSIKYFVNGSLIGTISQTTYPYTTIKQESTSYSNNIWGEVVFFPTNIADADAIALTTL